MTDAETFVEIRRQLSATPERVFAAFADARLVASWLRPAPEIKLSVLSFDFREGGAYRFAYDVPDVGCVYINGVYLTIDRPRRIVFSWLIEPPDPHADIPSEVTVTLAESGRGTELVIRHAKFGRADAEARHAEGWKGALEALAALLQD
ncbi:MAG TPA: SRPBCC domain-containing protein [Polyangiales bacterium]|nr:SRPBCC domain-containing protein [Polyangiales bacterium]